MNEHTAPTVSNVRRTNGAAGQIAVSGTVTYPGEPPATLSFVGSAYGAPVVMVTEGNPAGSFVTAPDRFGVFHTDPVGWFRRFVAGTADSA